jgi:hypothetical protein
MPRRGWTACCGGCQGTSTDHDARNTASRHGQSGDSGRSAGPGPAAGRRHRRRGGRGRRHAVGHLATRTRNATWPPSGRSWHGAVGTAGRRETWGCTPVGEPYRMTRRRRSAARAGTAIVAGGHPAAGAGTVVTVVRLRRPDVPDFDIGDRRARAPCLKKSGHVWPLHFRAGAWQGSPRAGRPAPSSSPPDGPPRTA